MNVVRGPVRTCVGCRARVQQSALLRVVLVRPAHGPSRIVPDERGGAPGRGAYLHRDPECLRRAETRHVLPRALRVAGAEISDEVRALCAAQAGDGPDT